MEWPECTRNLSRADASLSAGVSLCFWLLMGLRAFMRYEIAVRAEKAANVAGLLMLFPFQFAAFARQLPLQLYCWCAKETRVNELGSSVVSRGRVCGKG